MEVSKSDWKLFRARIGDWQETYMAGCPKTQFNRAFCLIK